MVYTSTLYKLLVCTTACWFEYAAFSKFSMLKCIWITVNGMYQIILNEEQGGLWYNCRSVQVFGIHLYLLHGILTAQVTGPYVFFADEVCLLHMGWNEGMVPCVPGYHNICSSVSLLYCMYYIGLAYCAS